jgi:hypothetical protein
LHFAESVRNTVGEVNGVLLLLKMVGEAELIIFLFATQAIECLRKTTLFVPYIESISVPIFRLSFDRNPHSLCIEALFLRKVQDVKGHHSQIVLIFN